jgi:hypothetical protein
MRARILRHFRIAIGLAEAEEIEAPDVESRLAQRIAQERPSKRCAIDSAEGKVPP